MANTNLINTPNIEGNIKSCEVKTVENITDNQVWRLETTVIFTNSCSGEIIKENVYYDYLPTTFVVLTIILFMPVLYALYRPFKILKSLE